MEGFQRVIRKITSGLCYFGMFFAIPLMLITTIDAIGRDFFDKPLPNGPKRQTNMHAVIGVVICLKPDQDSPNQPKTRH